MGVTKRLQELVIRAKKHRRYADDIRHNVNNAASDLAQWPELATLILDHLERIIEEYEKEE